MPKKVIYRSSVNGRIVKREYAKAHPRITEREVVTVPKQKKPPKKKGR